MGEYLNPDWENVKSNTPHEWRNYVSDKLRSIWGNFSEEQRTILGNCFQNIADAEDWD